MSDEAWIDSVVDFWAVETARSFSARDLHDSELDAALRGAAEAIRQVLAAAPDSPCIASGMDYYTPQPD